MNTVSCFAGDIVWKAEIITMLFKEVSRRARSFLTGETKTKYFPQISPPTEFVLNI